jgi:hypothetical protein
MSISGIAGVTGATRNIVRKDLQRQGGQIEHPESLDPPETLNLSGVPTMTSKTLRMRSLGTNEGLRREILPPRDGAARPVARPLAKPALVREG